MGGKAGQIHAEGIHVHGDFAERLRTIRMHQHTLRVACTGDIDDRLDHADLMVDQSDRNQPCLGANSRGDVGWVDKAVAANHQGRDLGAIEDTGMLDRRGENISADALERQIIGFGRARSEDDFPGIGADRRRDFAPGLLDSLARAPSDPMIPGMWVTEGGGEIGLHRLSDPWIERCRRVMVEIDHPVSPAAARATRSKAPALSSRLMKLAWKPLRANASTSSSLSPKPASRARKLSFR
jgi:hypothetical protein